MSKQKFDVKENARLVGHALFWYTPSKPSDLALYIEEVEKYVEHWKEKFSRFYGEVSKREVSAKA